MSVKRSTTFTTPRTYNTLSSSKRSSIQDFSSLQGLGGDIKHVEELLTELQTAEDLLAQSQKDNEQKHEQAEIYKQYAKALEKLLTSTLGPDWLQDHPQVMRPLAQSTTLPLTTPLPNLRHSTLSNKRSSHLRHNSVIDFGTMQRLAELPECVGEDDTPTGAMRRLQGIQDPHNPHPVAKPLCATPVPSEIGAMQRLPGVPSQDPQKLVANTILKNVVETPANMQLESGHIAKILSLLSSIPVDPPAPSSDLIHQKAAMMKMLDRADQRLGARQEALEKLVTDARMETERWTQVSG